MSSVDKHIKKRKSDVGEVLKTPAVTKASKKPNRKAKRQSAKEPNDSDVTLDASGTVESTSEGGNLSPISKNDIDSSMNLGD